VRTLIRNRRAAQILSYDLAENGGRRTELRAEAEMPQDDASKKGPTSKMSHARYSVEDL
jgi:hypothetical protein